MEKVRTIHFAGRTWKPDDYIYFFHDQDGIFETCVTDQVLSYFERVGNSCKVTREEIESYLLKTYPTGIYGQKGVSLEET